MAVSENSESLGYEFDKGVPVVSDIDKTLVKGDSGKVWLTEAGEVEPEDWDDFIEENTYPGLGHSNQLVHYLSQNPDRLGDLHEHIPRVEIPEREGLDTVLTHRYEHRLPNIGSSAGYKPVIQSVTNGNLHDIIAGDLEDETLEPIFNGQNEKRERVEEHFSKIGYDGEYVSLADSNGDLGKIRGAAESGGYGIVVAPSVEEARERVDEATFYVGDSNPDHHTAGALVNYVSVNDAYRMSPEEMRTEYGFDFSTAEVEPGELANSQDRQELDNFMEELGVR